MLNHIYSGIYICDNPHLLIHWQGAILSLNEHSWQPDHQIKVLPLANEESISAADIRQATAFIHKKQGHRIAIYCENNSGQAAIFALAYLIEYMKMNLADAYTLVASRTQGLTLPRKWLTAVVETYQLPLQPHEILDNYLFNNLLSISHSNISYIDRGIFLSGIDAMQTQEKVRQMGIQAILRLDDEDRLTGGQWASDFTLLDMAIMDGEAVMEDQVRRATKFLHQQVEAGNKVLVHCHAGISRSTTMVLAYLIEYGGMKLPAAFALTARCRPIVFPHSALVQSLARYYQLPYTAEEINTGGFLENLLVEAAILGEN